MNRQRVSISYRFGKLLCWIGWHDWRVRQGLEWEVRCAGDRLIGSHVCVRPHCKLVLLEEIQAREIVRSRRRVFIWAVAIIALLLWAATAQAATPDQDVTDAAIRHGIPPRLLDALWAKECSRRVVCPVGKHREWGPFQVRPVTAIEAGCTGYRWWIMPGNADCAARVLTMKGARPGRYLRALAGYNGCPKPKGVKRPCRSNWYAHRVYHAYLRAEMAMAGQGDQLLAGR